MTELQYFINAVLPCEAYDDYNEDYGYEGGWEYDE